MYILFYLQTLSYLTPFIYLVGFTTNQNKKSLGIFLNNSLGAG
jgi:hypothetical protein